MDNKSDPRVKDWFLMSSPFPTLMICLCYAYFSKVLGPKIMENKKPFDLKNTMIWYNFAQVIISTWLFSEVLHTFISTSVFYRNYFIDKQFNSRKKSSLILLNNNNREPSILKP
jgi:elongation of very long chain fatty acids protein 7